MFSHRNLAPAGAPPAGPSQSASAARLTEAFEIIRQEFDVAASDLAVARAQRDEFEAKVSGQVNELNIIRNSLYDLEAQHAKLTKRYEDELRVTRAELDALRRGASHPTPHPVNSSALPQQGLNGIPSQAPPLSRANGGPPFDPFLTRRDPRDLTDRDIVMAERDRERLPDPREAKRLKSERKDLAPPPAGPSGTMTGPGMPSTPIGHLSHPNTRPASVAPMLDVPPPMMGPGSLMPTNNSGSGSFLDDIDINNAPPELKKEGPDWFALFNPKVPRVLDVSLVHTLLHESVVCCVRFSRDGKFLATGCNRTAQIYDVKTGLKTCVLADDSAGRSGDLYIRSVCFSPDGKYLATGAEDKQIRIWDIAKKRIRNIFDGHQQEIYSLDFSSDGRLIVSGSGDRTARIWDMNDGTSQVLHIEDDDQVYDDAGVTSVAISPNGLFLAAGSLDTVVRVWDIQSGTLLEKMKGHRDSVYSVAFTPDGKGLISGSLDKTLKYWDVSGLVPGGVRSKKEGGGPNAPGSMLLRKEADKPPAQCTMNFTGHKDYVLSVAVSHDGQWVVSGSKDRGVQFWNAHTALVQCMLQGHKNSVISIDLSPAGNQLATGSGDWQARIWSYTTTS